MAWDFRPRAIRLCFRKSLIEDPEWPAFSFPVFRGCAKNIHCLTKVVFMAGSKTVGVFEEEDVAGLSGQPLEVGQAIVQRIPVVAEPVRKLQDFGDDVQEILPVSGLADVDPKHGKAGLFGGLFEFFRSRSRSMDTGLARVRKPFR